MYRTACVADLAHICRASGVTAEIDATAIPLSDAAFHVLQFAPALRPLILTGGDDYELIFTAPAANQAAIDAAAVAAEVAITCIGTIGPASVPPEAKPVRVMVAGVAMAIEDTGFSTFRAIHNSLPFLAPYCPSRQPIRLVVGNAQALTRCLCCSAAPAYFGRCVAIGVFICHVYQSVPVKRQTSTLKTGEGKRQPSHRR